MDLLEEYARSNDSYGLSTLTDDHVEVQGSTISFQFVGKSGKEHTVVYRNQRLAEIVKQCQDIAGYELFQYWDEASHRQVIDSSDVNDYLRAITGKSFTAKVFRTWGGSVTAIKYLCERRAEDDAQTAVKHSIAYVAQILGNTEAVTREFYVHPAIPDAYLNGVLCKLYHDHLNTPVSTYDLLPEEHALVALIEQTNHRNAE